MEDSVCIHKVFRILFGLTHGNVSREVHPISLGDLRRQGELSLSTMYRNIFHSFKKEQLLLLMITTKHIKVKVICDKLLHSLCCLSRHFRNLLGTYLLWLGGVKITSWINLVQADGTTIAPRPRCVAEEAAWRYTPPQRA